MFDIPTVESNHFIFWFESRFINTDSFDCTGRGAHSIFHVRAFERGTRRCGGAQQALAIAQDKLRICADINDQPVLILVVRLLG